MTNNIDRVAAALDNQDYKEASRLLKQLYKQSPSDAWVQFYIGRLYEETGKWEAAEKAYRQLLRTVTLPKVLSKARQGLQRLEEGEKARRQRAIARSKADPRSEEPGVLILEATAPERRAELAQRLARILQIDPYTAKLRLQIHGWRLYRTGSMGELKVYGEELQQAGLSVFWASLRDIPKIAVFRVCHFQSVSPQPTIVCRDEGDRLGQLTFDWSEVTHRVNGRLPIFVEAVHYDISRKTSEQIRRKTETQDYAQVCDLHLPGRRCILRLCDSSYQFDRGVIFSSHQQPTPGATSTATNRLKWNGMLGVLQQHLEGAKVWSEFTPFAETALEYRFLLESLTPHIDVLRPAPTTWDSAFQLYSTLVFLKNDGAMG
ncbi:MAG TPA: tetratricopeptide repeat protein [Oscillatoriales cyanobacterium M59_W2019_021]|nr:MAG: tetratricopeptide repeat protein [Cyanobacteria bacterium J055]HIK30166.1 tetratricopeptide repeat protein [Oscillatoriales cyanobacterium M4454_W2019_049]HIK52170.1 tetratricopeptide repeat protein [Oscillatoriales cyanobacterium M59_W2019_021]